MGAEIGRFVVNVNGVGRRSFRFPARDPSALHVSTSVRHFTRRNVSRPLFFPLEANKHRKQKRSTDDSNEIHGRRETSLIERAERPTGHSYVTWRGDQKVKFLPSFAVDLYKFQKDGIHGFRIEAADRHFDYGKHPPA